jgi:hypothetical protein
MIGNEHLVIGEDESRSELLEVDRDCLHRRKVLVEVFVIL